MITPPTAARPPPPPETPAESVCGHTASTVWCHTCSTLTSRKCCAECPSRGDCKRD